MINVYGQDDCISMGNPEIRDLSQKALNAALAIDNILTGNPKADKELDKEALEGLGELLTCLSEETDPRILTALQKAFEEADVRK